MEKIKILLVEDEEILAMVVKETLEKRGFEIAIATNGVDGWSKFNYDKPDICLIDIMMPRKDGLSLVADIRKVDELVPVIFLTARTQTADVLKGLEIGADDYIKKPFSMEELILRIKGLIRRTAKATKEVIIISEQESNATIGDYHFNYTRLKLIYKADVVTNLSQREAELLKLLLENKNDLLDKRTALLKIWGEDTIFTSRSMDVYVTRLRKYLLNDARVEIVNVRGRGYKLVD